MVMYSKVAAAKIGAVVMGRNPQVVVNKPWH